MTETENEDTESDSSPPAIPHALAEELARIIARALVADYRADLLKTAAVPATAELREYEPCDQGFRGRSTTSVWRLTNAPNLSGDLFRMWRAALAVFV